MEDLHKVGGIPALLKYLLKNTNLIDGSQLTVTGKTIAENLEGVPELDFTNQDVVRPLENPIKSTGHITILRGSLCPGSAVAKLTGAEGLHFEVKQRNLIQRGRFSLLTMPIRERRSVSTRKTILIHHLLRDLIICAPSLDGFYPALAAGEIKPGTVVIFRYQGPKGAPGMPEVK